MFGVDDFIKILEYLEVALESDEHFMLHKNYPRFHEKINELIELRHLIIHHEGYKGVLGFSRLFEIGKNLVHFVLVADIYMLEQIPLYKGYKKV